MQPEGLSGRITQRLSIPTIGIGAGVRCDGQVLVVDDMLGLFTDFNENGFAPLERRTGELKALLDQLVNTATKLG